MQRWSLILLFAIILSGLTFAQRPRPFSEFKVGGINPNDASYGNVFGASTGRKIDDRLYYGIGLDYYKSNYRRETTIAEFDSGGIRFRETELELEFTTRILTTMGQLFYELKLGQNTPFYFRSSAGVGLNFIWNEENNFLQDIDRTRFFWGIGWQLSAGLGIKISRSGLVFADVYYNDATASRTRERNQQGLPVSQTIDVSGFGIKVGVNIIGLGF